MHQNFDSQFCDLVWENLSSQNGRKYAPKLRVFFLVDGVDNWYKGD